MRRILARPEHDVLADRERLRIEGSCGVGGTMIVVHADPAEVMIEPRFEEGPGVWGKRPSSAAETRQLP
jgi:hypothetical protein